MTKAAKKAPAKKRATRTVKHKLIDLSSNNGHVDFKAVAGAGVFGAYIKATEGASYVDPGFVGRVAAARAAKLHVGFYHFARPDNNAPTDEVHNLLTHTAGQAADLIPVLDFEHAAGVGSIGGDGSGSLGVGYSEEYDSETHYRVAARLNELTSWAREFNAAYHRRTGLWPIFYSYPAFIAAMAPATPIGGGLWIAAYGKNDGRRHAVDAPAPWKHYKLHQYTSAGKVAGVSGPVDVSYAGTPRALVIKSGV